jgi:hypothetical protein
VSISQPHANRGTLERAGLARPQAVAVWAAWIAGLALALLAVAGNPPTDPGGTAELLLLLLSTLTVGAVLVTRLPHHIVGWLLLTGGLSLAISGGAGGLAYYGLVVHPGSVPGAVWFDVLGQAAGGAWIGLLAGFVPLYFPTGRLPSPRWRVVALLAIVPTVAPGIVNALSPFSAGSAPAGVANPLALGGLGAQLVALVSTAITVLGIPALLLVMASLVVRYRRAQGIEREQLKWFAYVGLVVVPAFVVAILTSGFTTGPLAIVTNVAWPLAIGGLALLPLAIGLAVLRYRLYEIDRLISRTIAYGLLTLLLGGLFVAVILLLQALIAPVTGSNELAVAASTLLVAALFQPLRRRVQRLVDRRFNRSRYDAERTVAALAARLRDEVDLEAVRADILATVDAALEPASSSLWLRG